MPKYIEQVKLYLLNKPVDVFTINETRLDKSISNVEVYIEGLASEEKIDVGMAVV